VFADGHSEVHVWKGSYTTRPVQFQQYYQGINVSSDQASVNDLVWFAQHTPAN